MRNLLLVPAILIGIASGPIHAQDFSQIVAALRGAKLIAQDEKNTFLGTFESAYAQNSIFNEYGSYGSSYSATSIWNDYGSFGGSYSAYSPFNSYTQTPPMIIKGGRVIGYLSTNKYLKVSINPGLLKAISDQF